jgi:hypothetical protein
MDNDVRMKRGFKKGDPVSWNSEAGRIRGTVQKKITAPVKFKTYTVRASLDAPQYLVKSDKTGRLAMHKESALRRIGNQRPGSARSTRRR